MPNAPTLAVLGFRPHTYWTAAVAVTGPPHAPRVIERRRIEFAFGNQRFAFHQAAEVSADEAAALIEAARAATTANAGREIAGLVADLQRADVTVRAAVVPTGGAKIPASLDDILASHARIHAAEGAFYRDVVASACERLGLAVHRAVERELPALVGDLSGVDTTALAGHLKAMGAALGPPWSEDQRLATLAAWTGLEGAH